MMHARLIFSPKVTLNIASHNFLQIKDKVMGSNTYCLNTLNALYTHFKPLTELNKNTHTWQSKALLPDLNSIINQLSREKHKSTGKCKPINHYIQQHLTNRISITNTNTQVQVIMNTRKVKKGQNRQNRHILVNEVCIPRGFKKTSY